MPNDLNPDFQDPIDCLTSHGVDFLLVGAHAPHERIGDAEVAILGLEDYVSTKRASGRPKDVSDPTFLRSALGPLPGDEP